LSSHNSVTEDSGLPGRDAVQLGEWLLTFRRIMVPWSSTLQDEGIKIYWNIKSHSPSDSVTSRSTWIHKSWCMLFEKR